MRPHKNCPAQCLACSRCSVKEMVKKNDKNQQGWRKGQDLGQRQRMQREGGREARA